MTIEELKNNNQISIKSYKVCKLNNIHSLIEIKDYYLTHGSFRNLVECGSKTIGEFLKLLGYKQVMKTYDSISQFEKRNYDIMLVDFYHRNIISRRSHNICQANGIDTLRELKSYYNQFKTFRYFPSCGVKINKELIELCKWEYDEKHEGWFYSINVNSDDEDNDDQKQLLINYLNQNKISKRAFQFCMSNGLNTKSQLKSYYKFYGTFKNITNCEENLDNELQILCRSDEKKQKDLSKKEKEANDLVNLGIILNPSNIDLHDSINEFIKKEYSLLSSASQKSLNLYFNDKINISHIKPMFYPEFKIGRIPKIRVNSISELRIFIEDIKEFINKLIEQKSRLELEKDSEL